MSTKCLRPSQMCKKQVNNRGGVHWWGGEVPRRTMCREIFVTLNIHLSGHMNLLIIITYRKFQMQNTCMNMRLFPRNFCNPQHPFIRSHELTDHHYIQKVPNAKYMYEYEIVSTKRPNTCFSQDIIFLLLIFKKSEMSSTHGFLRTENRSICHGVVTL